MDVIVTTPEELRAILTDCLAGMNPNLKPAPQKIPQEAERPISQQEAIKFLGKSRQTLILWRKKGVIKGYRLGGRIYYKPSELVSALEKLS